MAKIMANKAMQRKIEDGDAIDISGFERTANGEYKIPEDIFDQELDYCNAATEEWVWSIGKNKDGVILAAMDARFYQSDDHECLWLR